MEQLLPNIAFCCGCGTCVRTCRHNAVSLQENGGEKYKNQKDIYGFYYPVIDESLCVNCFECKKTCPILNPAKKHEEPKTCYAAAIKDKDIKQISSTGGLCTILAQECINDSGIVCGAAYDDNDPKRVRHIAATNIKELQKQQKSKYIQSDTEQTFAIAAQKLTENRRVMFVGNPCQAAGLKNYLDFKAVKQDNLLIVDLVCHGVPSHVVFRRYLKETLPQDAKITSVDFRYKKDNSWKQHAVRYVYTLNGKEEVYIKEAAHDLFMRGFLGNLFLRTSCTHCQFSQSQRVGDITLGDFWKIDDFDKNIDDDTGTAIMLVNSQKGHDATEKIKNKLTYMKPFDLQKVKHTDPGICSPAVFHKNHKQFLHDFIEKNKPVLQNMSDCLDKL